MPELLSGTLPFDVSSVSVRTAGYSFLQLSEWRELIEPTIWASDDITGLALDEQIGQLIVLLDTGRGEEEIRAAARLLGVPDAALGFEVSGEPVATDHTLHDTVRPTRGGTQTRYLKNNGEGYNCTYGFNAVMGSDTVMVTNSDCTPPKFGAPLNGQVWQPEYYQPADYRYTPPIGTEFIDPRAYGCGYIFWKCRKSDSAAYLLEIPSADIGLYQIARTTSRSHGENGSGSIIISHDNPYFNITTELSHPSKGTYLNKIG